MSISLHPNTLVPNTFFNFYYLSLLLFGLKYYI